MNDNSQNNNQINQGNSPATNQKVQQIPQKGQASVQNNAPAPKQSKIPKPKPKITEQVVSKGSSRHWQISEKTVAFTMVAAIIVLLGVSSFISLRYMNERKNKKEVPANLLITPTLTEPLPTISPVGDWEVYEDPDNGFTFKYPPSASLGQRHPDPFPVAIQVQYIDTVQHGGGGPENPGWLIIFSEPQPNPEKLTLRQWAEDKKLASIPEGFDINTPPAITDTNIGDQEAITWKSPVFDSHTQYLVKSPDGVIYIGVNISSPFAKQHQETVNQILSTFKLIDKNSTAGWKTASTNSNGTLITSNWTDYQFSDEKVITQLQYPPEWSLDNSVFNENGKKVAEFSPGSVKLSSNQKCYDNYISNSRSEIIKQENITVGAYNGTLAITKVLPEPGPDYWYPNTYCLQEDDKAFVITFYEYREIPEHEDLYNLILSTVNIE